MIKDFSLIKKTLVVIISALIGAVVFYSFSMGFMFLLRFVMPNNQAEAAPPLWVWLFVIVVPLGMVLSAVFAGFFGYSRYCKTLTHQSSGTGESILR